MAETRALGVSSPRVADEEKVGGEAIYAVANAVGVGITSLPISAEKVLKGRMRDKESRSD
jgi:hypothetical protein